MLPFSALRDVPDELANRMMVAHGSRMLLRALRGEPEPVEREVAPLPPRPRRSPPSRPYVPVSDRPRTPTPQAVRDIIAAVAEAFGVSGEELVGKSRAKRLVHARAVVYRLIRDRTFEAGGPRNSIPQIAAYLDRDHSTVSWALDNFEVYCRIHPGTREIYERLRGAE